MITLATLSQATPQQVFDQAVTHLLTQNAQSRGKFNVTNADGEILSEQEGCLYRGPNGTSCAAGCFIADDEYSADMENLTWTAMISNKGVTSVHADLISGLQQIHDSHREIDWRDALANLASNHKLKFNPPAVAV